MDRRLESTGLIFHTGNTETDVIRLELINVFREVFGSNGALLYKGECAYNSSPYEFNYKELWENTYKRSEGDSIPVQKVEDKKILILMSSEMYMGNPYTVVFYNDITEIYERTARLFAKGLMMTLVLLLLTGGILYRSLSYTIRPLLQLKDAAAAISEGNYQVRVDDSRKDEIGQLAKSFNHMAMTVQENIEALTSTNETQRRMLGSLAHELKTPISAIMMSLKLLEDNRIGKLNTEQESLSRNIKENSDRLLEITSELLKMSQVESGKLYLNPKITKPIELIDYAIKANRVQAERFNCQIEVEYPEKNAKLYVDSEKIAWVVTNLLSNAIRYSSENGRIIIGARQIDKAVEIYVKDFGKGIDSRYHESIFDHYFRVPGTKVQGSGLGLAISKDFVEAHGGTIRIESEVDKCSTFVIRFNV